MDKINIYGVNIDNVTLKQVLDLLDDQLKNNNLFTIATPNTEIVMEAKDNKSLQNTINAFDLVVADGIGLIYASKFRNLPLKERVTGYDISLGLLEKAREKNIKFFFLGAKPGVAHEAKSRVEKEYKNASVVGVHHGYFSQDEEIGVINHINKASPDVIFVGLGFPKQEEFIQRNKNKLSGKIIIGNGGVIDILAGRSERAPDIFINLNLEWLYRLIKEPSRITRQISLPKFVINVLLDKDSVKKGDN